MLAIVQFPIADARVFAGAQRLRKPVWRALQESVDFVPRFGGARTRSAFHYVPSAWRDDAQYVGAHHAIRMRGVAQKILSGSTSQAGRPRTFWAYRPATPATDLHFTPAFRRLLFDGVALTRIEIGFWVIGDVRLEGNGLLGLVRDVLDLQTEVAEAATAPDLRAAKSPSAGFGRLGDQGNRIARLLWYATTPGQTAVDGGEASASSTDMEKSALLQPTVPVVFVDDTMHAEQLARRMTPLQIVASELGEPTIAGFPARASVVPGEHTGAAALAFTTVKYRERRFAAWLVSSQRQATAQPDAEVRNLRICLMRLHATRQILYELRRMSIAGVVDPRSSTDGAPSFNAYVKSLARQVLTPDAFGTNQAELNRVLSLYDLGVGSSERQRIETAFLGVDIDSQVMARVNEAVRTNSESRAVEHVIFNFYDMRRTVTHQTTNVTASGQGSSIVIHELNQVAGNYLRESKEVAEAVKREELKTALDALHAQVTELAGRLPPGPDQEAAARKLKQVTEEAAAPNPDKDMLKVTGKGLIEAAKTVAEMVGPVTKAVTGLLALFGLVI